jgi:hypothetical protein
MPSTRAKGGGGEWRQNWIRRKKGKRETQSARVAETSAAKRQQRKRAVSSSWEVGSPLALVGAGNSTCHTKRCLFLATRSKYHCLALSALELDVPLNRLLFGSRCLLIPILVEFCAGAVRDRLSSQPFAQRWLSTPPHAELCVEG